MYRSLRPLFHWSVDTQFAQQQQMLLLLLIVMYLICQELISIREGAKNILRGGFENVAAFCRDFSPPPIFYPSTLSPFFWLSLYRPPIFLVNHLPSPPFSGQTSTHPPISQKKMFLWILYIYFSWLLERIKLKHN